MIASQKKHSGGASFRQTSAFTLLEIMLVIALLGVLALFATIGIRHAIRYTRTQQTEQDLERLAAAIEHLAWDTGRWPGTHQTSGDQNLITLSPVSVQHVVQDLRTAYAGILNNSLDLFPNWRGPYVDRIEKDPWGMNYFFNPAYRIRGEGPRVPVVGSSGPNRTTHSQYGDHDDIVVSLEHLYRQTQ